MTAPTTTEAPARSKCRDAPVPDAGDLSWEAYGGRACFACGKQLTSGAVSCGRAIGRQGVHKLDVEVWSCP